MNQQLTALTVTITHNRVRGREERCGYNYEHRGQQRLLLPLNVVLVNYKLSRYHFAPFIVRYCIISLFVALKKGCTSRGVYAVVDHF